MNGEKIEVKGSRSLGGTQVSRATYGNGSFGGVFKYGLLNVDTQYLEGDLAAFADIPSTPAGTSFASADNQAKSKFVSACLDARTALQGLTVLGELRETIRMVKNPALSLRKKTSQHLDKMRKRFAVNDAGFVIPRERRRSFSTRRRQSLTKTISDSWLEFAFGVAPLLSDIDSGAKAMSRIVTYNPPSVVVHGKGKSTESVSVLGQSLNRGMLQLSWKVLRELEAEVRYKGVMRLSQPNFRSTAVTQLGLSWADVVPAVWELIPYSFLVDYFTNVQEVVNAMCFNRSSLGWCERGIGLKRTNTLLNLDCGLAGLGTGQKYLTPPPRFGSGTSVIRTNFQRDNYIGHFIPSLEFSIPGSSRKWLNIGALFGSRR
jgi:hypothetical protein